MEQLEPRREEEGGEENEEPAKATQQCRAAED